MRRPSRDVSKETHVRCLLPEKPEASRRERRQYAGVGGAMSCPDCAGTGWIPPEMTEEHPRQSACMKCAALKESQGSVTPRDVFAAAAMAGFAAHRGAFGAYNDEAKKAAVLAFDIAKAMMAERAKR